MSKGMRRVVLALMLALGTGNLALADSITFDFSGDVSFVDPLLAGTFNTTQTISGSYTFESTTVDNFPADPKFGQYTALTALSFNIDGYAATGIISSGALIVALDGLLFSGDDYFAQITDGFAAPTVAGSAPSSFGLQLTDTSGTALSSDALPLTPPPLGGFDIKGWELLFFGGANAIRGSITSLESTTVPEPATSVLLLSGLVMVGLAKRKRAGEKRRSSRL